MLERKHDELGRELEAQMAMTGRISMPRSDDR